MAAERLGGVGAFTNIAGATSDVFTPGQDQVNRQLQVVVTFTDLQGHLETVTSDATGVVGDFIAANAAAQTLNGSAGQDIIFGGGGCRHAQWPRRRMTCSTAARATMR